MKSFFAVLATIFSLSTFAQSGDVKLGPLSISIAGRGSFVCSAQGGFSEPLVLARGESEAEARVLSLQKCGDTFFCKVKNCERDAVNGNSTEVTFDITREGANINFSYSGNVKYLCRVEAWGKIFVAKTPTKVEGKYLVSNECAKSNSGSAFFCENIKCDQVSGTTVEVNTKTVRGLLKKIIQPEPECLE